jgi:hypothetical protein
MNNLSSREKAFIYVMGLLIVIVLGYFFGIRSLNKKYDEYETKLAELNERKAYLDQLMVDNAEMDKEISNIEAAISEVELSFLDNIDTECIEQYLLDTFEDKNCPYLKSVETEEIECAPVILADGSTSADQLECLRVTLTYSTTDGFNVTQYNLNPDTTALATDPTAAQVISEQLAQIGSPEIVEAGRQGYDEFISAVKAVAAENPDCIKVTDIAVEDQVGFMLLTVSVDFYGTNLTDRVSTDSSTEAYTSWKGHTNVATDAGFIGYPYVVRDENSLWYKCINLDASVSDMIDRPFAPYWANAAFVQSVNNAGSLATFLGVDTTMAANGGVHADESEMLPVEGEDLSE